MIASDGSAYWVRDGVDSLQKMSRNVDGLIGTSVSGTKIVKFAEPERPTPEVVVEGAPPSHITGKSKIATKKGVYKVRGNAGKVEPGTVVESKDDRGKFKRAKVTPNGKFSLRAKLGFGRNVIKIRTVTPGGKKSRFSKVIVTRKRSGRGTE